MEKQLFDWETWDMPDKEIMRFFNIKTKIKIGNWDVGTSFDYAEMNYEEGTVEFGQGNGEFYRAKFKMLITLQEPAMVALGILG